MLQASWLAEATVNKSFLLYDPNKEKDREEEDYNIQSETNFKKTTDQIFAKFGRRIAYNVLAKINFPVLLSR